MNRLVWRASRRYLYRRPAQLAMAVIGIALGVAVVVAVDLANDSARRGFELSMDTLSGSATHQIVGGPSGLDEQVYVALRTRLGLRNSAPVVEGWGKIGGHTVHLIGVDPFAESGFRTFSGRGTDLPLARLLSETNTVATSRATAKQLGMGINDRAPLTLAGKTQEIVLAGFATGDSSPQLDGLLITDISTAQELTDHIGKLSWIDLKLSNNKADERARIEALLPRDAQLLPAETRTDSMAQMSAGFHTNLTAMSLLALVVGMFLIYNTMTFTVLQRRALFGNLRVLGVTPRSILALIMLEAALLGAFGTLLGLLLGIGLGQGLVQLVTRTINDLYFALSVSQLTLTPTPVIKGLIIGLAATLLAALLPAIDAAATKPQLTLRRSLLEERTRSLVPRLAILGAFMTGVALLALIAPGRNLLVAFTALFLLILGLTLATPWLVARITEYLAPIAGRVFGVQAKLAIRGISASLSRTGAAIAALMLAVATTVGVGIMVESFRVSVDRWLQSTLRADIYVTTPGLRSSRTQTQLDPALVQRIRAVKGVVETSTGRNADVESEHGQLTILALDTATGRPPQYLLKTGDPDTAWRRLLAGEAVFLSEPLAWQRQLGIGDNIAVRTDQGSQTFPIAATYYDYRSGPGVVLMHRSLYNRHFQDRAVDSVGLYVAAGVEADAVINDIQDLINNDERVVIRSNRDLRSVSLEIFDRTFTITSVLRLLAVFVAFAGIFSSLMALQLERARELGVLRATGATPGQLLAQIGVQTGLMGLLAGLLALPTGILMSQLLIHVINRRSFGWSMDTHVSFGILAQAVVLALAAALLAALYPAWKMARTPPAAALREE